MMEMTHIHELVPEPGERHLVIGGTRAGKSSLMDWGIRDVQRTRPDAMQIIVDTKPRFRAEQQQTLMGKGRKSAAKLYESWTKGPVVPNSVLLNLWDEKPFKGLFKKPGEVVIMQSGEYKDWIRMLVLLSAFVKAQIKGRERRMIVDECLDFTIGILGESPRVMMSSIGQPGRAANERSELSSGRIAFMGFRRSSSIWQAVSRFFTYVMTLI
jgi:hypothetical protein